jgi:hypothetical protein
LVSSNSFYLFFFHFGIVPIVWYFLWPFWNRYQCGIFFHFGIVPCLNMVRVRFPVTACFEINVYICITVGNQIIKRGMLS